MDHDYKVSKEHFIDVWDFLMEFSAITIQFGFYPDLRSIKYIKPKKSAEKKAAKAEPEADDDAEEDEEEGTLEI